MQLSVQLVLSSAVLFLCDQMTDIRPRQTSVVVTTLTGNPPHNTHGYNSTHSASVLRVKVLHAVQCNLRCLDGSSNVQITKHAVSVSCSECLSLVTAITFIKITVLVLGLGLCLSNNHTIILLIPHFRNLNTTIDFYIVLLPDSSSTFFNKCLTIPLLPVLPFPPSLQST